MPALPADPVAPAFWIALFSMSTGWPARPTPRIASLTLPWNVFLSTELGPPIFRPVVGGPLLRKSARTPWLPLLGPLQTPVGQPKVVPVTASGVPSPSTPSAKVGPIALPLMTREWPFVMWTPVVAYRMASCVIVHRIVCRVDPGQSRRGEAGRVDDRAVKHNGVEPVFVPNVIDDAVLQVDGRVVEVDRRVLEPGPDAGLRGFGRTGAVAVEVVVGDERTYRTVQLDAKGAGPIKAAPGDVHGWWIWRRE